MTFASGLDVHVLAVGLAVPAPDPVVQPVEVGDLLFGEVIDISDLLPSVLSIGKDAPTPAVPVPEAAAPAGVDRIDTAYASTAADHAPTLSIFYDDDLLASDGMFL